MKTNLVMLIMICSQILSSQDTFLNFETALEQASEENKHILMVFSGSDWCKPCIQLKKEVLESSQFLAREDIILLYLDFPYKRKNKLEKQEQVHNELLAERYNQEGSFPKVILFNGEGEIVNEISYEQAMVADDFINQLNIK